jgi:hypothetical protein
MNTFGQMCGTIDPRSCIRCVHGFGIKTGYDTYQIQPPCRERPGNRYGLQLMRRHVFLVREKLTTLTPMD